MERLSKEQLEKMIKLDKNSFKEWAKYYEKNDVEYYESTVRPMLEGIDNPYLTLNQITSKQTNQTGNGSILMRVITAAAFLIGMLFVGIVIYLSGVRIFGWDNPETPEDYEDEPISESVTVTETTSEGTKNITEDIIQGKIQGYSFTIVLDRKNNRNVAAFYQKKIPADDALFLTIAKEIVNITYGGGKVDNSNFIPKVKNALNVQTLKGIDGEYCFYPMKDASGEINSVMFWKE